MLKEPTLFFAAALLGSCGQAANRNSTVEQSASQSSAPIAKYSLKLTARPLASKKVEFTVTTDAPLPIEIVAEVTLAGLRDDETWIGEEQKATLDDPVSTFVLDTGKNGKLLPSGKYIAEVDYFQQWGAANNPAAHDVPDMSATQEIWLGGSGESAGHARNKAALQRWVLGEMDFSRPWPDAELKAKLGSFECYTSSSAILSEVCYFPDADVSLFVDRNRHKVLTAKLGRVG